MSIASGLAYITKNAASYFIPAIINSFILIILALGSLVIKKPLAAWASHLTRGWPFTITILIISYIYGVWRLKELGGPGVEEFQENKEPPWEGQKKGF